MGTERTATLHRHITLALTRREVPASVARLLRHLASEASTELHALFIEDSDLLKAAALPFTLEFCTLTHVSRPINPALIEAQLRSEATAAEAGLARLAATIGRHWRFEVVRASGKEAWLAALATSDVVILPPHRGERGHQQPSRQIVAIIDDSAVGERALALATRVAHDESSELQVFRVADGSAANNSASPASSQVIEMQRIGPLLRRSGPLLTILAGPLVERIAPSDKDLYNLAGAPLLIMR